MVNTTSNSVNKRATTRLSLTRLLTFALTSMLAVFIGFTLIAYLRLADFRLILSNIEDELVPTIISSGQASNQITNLIYLTESLSKASNETERISSYVQLKERLKYLHDEDNLNSKEPYLSTQLKTIDIELDELNELTEQKLTVEKTYKALMLRLVYLYKNALASHHGKLNDNQWLLRFIRISTNVALINNMQSLGDIRQAIKNINGELSHLKVLNSSQLSRIDDEHNRELINILTGEQGILNLRVELVLIRGRTLGRGNFVRNLLLDYASGANFQSYKTNESVISEVAKSLERVDQNISKTVLIASIFTLLLLAAILFIHMKLTRRLKLLYQHVRASLTANKYDFSYGKDEISDIYNIFELFVHDVEHQRQRLREISLTDALTEIPNRRAFDKKLSEYWNLAKREQWPISILMIDVDHFKAFNDNYGHLKGDECLREVSTILQTLMKRNGDFLARYGGEEFACILLNTKENGAEKVAKNIINAMVESKIPHPCSDTADFVTVSIGGATCLEHPTELISTDELISLADSALYQAKDNGRNCYQLTTNK